ncbi:hypothetical protein INT48_001842 [Thamnidium elegans]|uniref:Uncharacterized protein n=1 Tax=Thamnidium elegans TaxID=101142 RepID=A0A8H7SU59_9FUNG|nr:hypothetical protein INT48_001842 [Thamnidium elegans]
MTELIFANNFWGLKDDGFHALTAKMSNTKKTFDEIKSFYNVRASLHEEFGRKLMKHAKVGMGREETGTLQALLTSAHKETEWTAQAHLNLAQKLKTRLEVDLDNFILEQKDKRKLVHTNVEKAHRYKQSNETYLAKVKEKYESDCAKLITLQTQITTATGREADRMKQRIDRTQHEIKIQEQEYKNACIKVADATKAWNQTWKISCDTYQGMEKKRLEFLRHSFSMYINILSTATSQDQESYERFWKSLDQYDPINDIQIFINEKGTGPKIPEPEIFVDYMDDPTKTFQKHTLADFSCPIELITNNCTEPAKPELTVRNPNSTIPNVTQPEDSLLLKRVRSITVSNQVAMTEPLTPSKSSTSERRKSCLRTAVKPLPSISTPIKQRKQTRKKLINENYSSGAQQPIPLPPIIAIPEISSSSTTSEEEDSVVSGNSTNSRKQEDGDITIDPRAKVVFAIGNNMFDLGHLDLDESKKSDINPRRLVSTRRRQPSADLEAACNFSYQSLLEELGVFDKNSNSSSPTNNDDVRSPVENKDVLNRLSQREKRPAQQQQQYQTPEAHQAAHMVHAGVPAYSTQQTATPIMTHPINSYGANVYNPPSMAAPVGHQPTLFWAQAIGDWYSGKPEELQYSRGTWLAVTETRPDGWFYATKFDSRLNTLTNEKGYVAQNYIQFTEYQVVGRKLPSAQEVAPKLFRMRIFAPNVVVAKSRFWYFLKKLRKVKKAAGEIVAVNVISEKRPEQVKNFGVWIRYDSRSGTHNMYKEYRALRRVEAVETCYQDMAARHRARFRSVQIIRVAEVKDADVRRPYIKQLMTPKLAFPLPHRLANVEKKHRALFVAKRPTTFY